MSLRTMLAAFAALAAPAVLLAGYARAQEPPQPPAPAPAASDADAKAMFESACSLCHEASFAAESRKTRDGWAFTVNKMIDRGAPLTPEDAAVLVDYLARTYPKTDTPQPDAPKPPG